MEVKLAGSQDNQELMDLQARCPQGIGLVSSLVNTPDFFARAAPWPQHAVFKVEQDQRIIASASCAVVEARINRQPVRVGYQFEAFVDPRARRCGAAGALLDRMAEYQQENQASLAYALVMQGNSPSLGLVATRGFTAHRDLTMHVLLVYRRMAEPEAGTMRPARPEDLEGLARLQNRTWEDFDFHQPVSGQGLAAFLERTPGHGLGQMLVLEGDEGLRACAGVWDWGSITRVTVISTTWSMKLKGLLLDLLRPFKPLPRMAKPGQELKQWCLTCLGFDSPDDLAALLARVNNQAREQGVDTVFLMAQDAPWVDQALAGFIQVPVRMHLMVRPLGQGVMPGDDPVHLDGIHL